MYSILLFSFSSFSQANNLTSAEQAHQIAEQACNNELSGECNGTSDNQKGIGYLKAAFSMLTMGSFDITNISGMFKAPELSSKMKDKIAKKATTSAEKDKMTKQAEKSGTVRKICDALMVVSNGAVLLSQSLRENNILKKYQSSAEEFQVSEQFYTMANIHEGKRKDYRNQAVIFTSGAVCYGIALGLAIWPQLNPEEALQSGIRLALAGALTVAYEKSKRDKEKVRDKALATIKAMPTQTACQQNSNCSCLIADPTSPDYQTNCLSDQYAITLDGENISCIDATGKSDLLCACKETNSCFDSTLASYLKTIPDSHISKKDKNFLLDEVKNVSRGNFSNYSGSKRSKILRSAKKQLAKVDSLINPSKSGNKSNYKLALSSGIPKNLASHLSKIKISKEIKNEKRYVALSKKSSTNIHRTSVPHFPTTKKKSSFDFKEKFSVFNKKSKGGINISRSIASKKSFAKAGIRKAHQPLFKVITTRYMKSSWRMADEEN